MSKSTETPLQVVYIVTCYQNIVGVYASIDDAILVQKEYIAKNRPADVLARSVLFPTMQ